MIRCLVVDDEAYATKIIADYIRKVPYLQLVGTTTHAIEALSTVQQGGIDLVFLDIQMPELTGIQFMKISGNKCKIILTTAYPEYALEGFEHDVIDYLLKPVAFDRFLKATQKAWNLLDADKDEDVGDKAAVKADPVPVDYMFIKGESKNKFLKVDYKDILFIEGLKNYVSVYTPGQRIVTYQTLRDLETALPQPPFIRVHRSYILSIDKIRMVDGNIVYIGDHSIPIGETYRDGFFKLIR
jgi:DNA-binding LytR/AlgR family response regulator